MSLGLVLMMMTAAQAQTGVTQCFSDAKQAYDYLVVQEQLESEVFEQSRTNAVVDINTATEAELTRLKGIGSHKAQAIIRYRNTFGNFDTIDRLVAVKGIGVKTVEKNRSRLTISSDTPP